MSKKIKNVVYFIGLAILCSMVIVSTFNIFGVINQRQKQQQDIVYNYQRNGNIEYKVYLNKNDFIKDQYLGANQYYVSQLVNYIATTFDYKFNGDKNAKLEYSYDIKGILTGEYSDNKVSNAKAKVWTKEYILKNPVVKTIEGKDFEVSENLNINLNSYNSDVQNFQQALAIPISAKLTIQFNISINGTVDNKNVAEKDTIYMAVPLNTTVFAIDGPYNINDDGKILKTESVIALINNEMIANGIIFIVCLLLMAIIIKDMVNVNKSDYQLELEEIMNQYGNRIVVLKNFLNMPEQNYVNIASFDELIDLVDELNIPILCLHRHSRELRETWFIVMNEKVVYRYILKANK